MKSLSILSAIFVSFSALFGAEDPSLLFKLTFDSYSLNPDHAKGAKTTQLSSSKGFETPDLQLRMHGGIPGNKNSLCVTNSEFVHYSNYKNFNPKQGTVSFWVSPKNWKPSTKKRFQVFFRAQNPGGFNLDIVKWPSGDLRFAIYIKNKDVGAITVKMPDSVWKTNSWHKIDAVWNEEEMSLYVDGVRGKVTNIYSVFNPLKFKSKKNFPETKPGGSIRINDGTWFAITKTDSTAYDEIKIYDRRLSAAEIQKEYLKVFPAINKELKKTFAPVPLTAKNSIKIDGKLDAGEWKNATSLPLSVFFVRLGKDYIRPVYGNKVMLKHDNEYLYLGADFVGKDPRASAVARDEDALWRNDDAVELHFAKGKTRYQYIINAKGVFWDGTGVAGQTHIPNGNVKWSSDIKIKTALNDKGWTLECAIPLKDLNLKGANDSIFANFYKSYFKNYRYSMTWATQPAEFFSDKYFGILNLRNDDTFVRIDDKGELLKGNWNVSMQASPGVTAGGSLVSLGVNYSTSGNIVGSEWKKTLEGGTWTYTINARKNNKLIASQTGRFTYDASISMIVRGRLKENCINARLSIAGIYGEVAAAVKNKKCQAYLTLSDKKGNVKRNISFVPDKPELTVKIPLGNDLPSGEYTVKSVIKMADVTKEHSQKFIIPDLTPYKLKLMDDHTVPAPWFPVKQLSSNKFEVWNRIYTFTQAPLPAQIVTKGNKLLSTAPDFYLETANGKEKITWSDFKLLKKYDDMITFSGKGISKSLKFNWRGELHFDGMWKLDLAVSPIAKSVNIKDFTLKYSVPKRDALVLINPYFNELNKKFTMKYSRSLNDFLIWTTGTKYGIAWMPITSANWINDAKKREISLTPNQNNCDVSISYINKNAVLKKTADYSMLFMATPSKLVDPKLRNFNLGHHTGWGNPDFVPGENVKCNGHGNDKYGYKQSYTTHPWATFIPYNKKKFKAYLDGLAKDGIKYMPYGQPAFISKLEPEYEFFIEDWKLIPGIVGGSAYNYKDGSLYESISTCQDSGSADYHMTLLKKCLDDYPELIGVYYDLCHVSQCSNRNHGHGGFDAFGIEYSHSNVMSLRNFLKRTYKMCVSRGKLQKVHAHSRFAPFAHPFSHVIVTGEQYNGHILRNIEHFFTESIPLLMFQTIYNEDVVAMRMIFGSHLEMQPLFAPGGKWDTKFVRDDRLTIKFLTPMLLHGIGVNGYYSHRKTIGRYFTYVLDTKLSEAEFNGYWNQQNVSSKSPKVYVSYYKWNKTAPYKYVFVISNLNRKDQPAALNINFKKLGIDPAKAVYYDVWNKAAVKDIKTLTVKGENFRIIGVK